MHLEIMKMTPVVKRQKVVPGTRTSVPVIHKKKQKKHNHRNLKQIFILSFDALKRKKSKVCANNIDGCRR